MEENVEHRAWLAVLEFDAIALFLCAIGTLVLASFRSVSLDALLKKNKDWEEISQIQTSTVLIAPITGSFSLILFYYYFHIVSFFMAVMTALMATFGMVFVYYPLFQICFPKLDVKEIRVPCIGPIPALAVALYPFTIVLVAYWFVTGHWILNNLLGITMSVVAVAFVRLPSVRVASGLLIGLFIYDIFWVFYSSRIFGDNVMQAVATRPASNPMVSIASSLNMSSSYFVAELQLPMKIISGTMIIGLGDIVVPSLLTSLVLRWEKARSTSGYFLACTTGYAVGLIITIIIANVFQIGQPALLYLVPCTLVPILSLALHRSEFTPLWIGEGLEDEMDNKSND